MQPIECNRRNVTKQGEQKRVGKNQFSNSYIPRTLKNISFVNITHWKTFKELISSIYLTLLTLVAGTGFTVTLIRNFSIIIQVTQTKPAWTSFRVAVAETFLEFSDGFIVELWFFAISAETCAVIRPGFGFLWSLVHKPSHAVEAFLFFWMNSSFLCFCGPKY